MSDIDPSVGNHLFWILHVLMIAARTVSALTHPRTFKKIERDLTEVIEDFDRATNVEALRQIKETGGYLFLAMVHD